MTDEQMRIAIAEACDLFKFKPLRYATRKGRLLEPGEKGVRLMYCSGGTNGWEDWEDIPDYLNDLNAMHEAEKVLIMDFNKPDQWEKYMDELNRLCYPDHEEEPEILGRRYIASCRRQHADARTKAIAFIKTLNLEPA